jgi:protein gp37
MESELEKVRKWKKPRSIFVQSMGDLFHEEVSDDFITDVFHYIDLGRAHTYIMLTKRPRVMLAQVKRSQMEPSDYPHIYFGLTVCNQAEWDEKKKWFLRIPGKLFISHEPALERIDYGDDLKRIAVLISGGENARGARPSWPDIFRNDREQTFDAGIDFFFKGYGNYKGEKDWTIPPGRLLDGRTHDDLPWHKGD